MVLCEEARAGLEWQQDSGASTDTEADGLSLDKQIRWLQQGGNGEPAQQGGDGSR